MADLKKASLFTVNTRETQRCSHTQTSVHAHREQIRLQQGFYNEQEPAGRKSLCTFSCTSPVLGHAFFLYVLMKLSVCASVCVCSGRRVSGDKRRE